MLLFVVEVREIVECGGRQAEISNSQSCVPPRVALRETLVTDSSRWWVATAPLPPRRFVRFACCFRTNDGRTAACVLVFLFVCFFQTTPKTEKQTAERHKKTPNCQLPTAKKLLLACAATKLQVHQYQHTSAAGPLVSYSGPMGLQYGASTRAV